VICLVGLVFGISLPFTYILNNGVPTKFGASFVDDADADEIDDPVLDALCLKAVLYLNNEQFDKAIAAYTEAIQRNPKFSLAYIGRGDVYLAKNDYDHALADFDQAARLEPKNEDIKRRADVVREVRANR
jgi:tetratricopeptide (TPR) repeat protein